jgi:hypothetical protein
MVRMDPGTQCPFGMGRGRGRGRGRGKVGRGLFAKGLNCLGEIDDRRCMLTISMPGLNAPTQILPLDMPILLTPAVEDRFQDVDEFPPDPFYDELIKQPLCSPFNYPPRFRECKFGLRSPVISEAKMGPDGKLQFKSLKNSEPFSYLERPPETPVPITLAELAAKERKDYKGVIGSTAFLFTPPTEEEVQQVTAEVSANASGAAKELNFWGRPKKKFVSDEENKEQEESTMKALPKFKVPEIILISPVNKKASKDKK